MKRNHFFLPVEVKDRELDSRLLLALKLVEKGIPVVIGDRGGCAREIKYIPESTYLAKSLSIDYLKTFQEIKKNNGNVWVLFEEGALVGREKDGYEEVKSFYPERMLQFVEFVLTYGVAFQEFLIENFNYFSIHNTFVSGNVRFDLHKPKYFEYLNDQVNRIKNEVGKYILINGNFGLANHCYGQEYIINEISSNKDLSADSISTYLKRIEKKKNSLKSFIEMIKHVAKEFNEFTIVVRPYPGEKLDIYKNELKSFNNVIVTNNGMASPWIVGSELVIHQDCTTGIESTFAGKPVISYLKSYDIDDSFKLAVDMSEITYNLDELVTITDSYLRKKQQYTFPIAKKEILYNQIANVYEETSNLILKKVLETNRQNDHHIFTADTKISLKDSIERFFIRKKKFIGWYRRKYFQKNDIYTLNFDGLTKQEIVNIFNKFKKIEKMNFEIDIKKLSINTFLITKSNR